MSEPAFRFHTPEWDEGYRAGRRGRSEADNPYLRGSRKAQAWSMGLSDGLTRQLTLIEGAGRPTEPQPSPQPPELPPNPEEPAPDPLPRSYSPDRPVRDILSLNA